MSKGYVYILTNPSFRKDWVKIGKTSRPVNTRSKELDNTAVPLPFEIYATLKTTEFANAEKLIHKMIDRLTNKRIRKSREFFNIEPEVALEILRDVRDVLGGEIAIECSPKAVRRVAKVAQKECILFCRGGGADARGRISGDAFLVLKGSRLSDHVVPSFKKRAHGSFVKRNELIADGTIRKNVFVKDTEFTSPTVAACVIQGRNSNGQWDWCDGNGVHLRDLKA